MVRCSLSRCQAALRMAFAAAILVSAFAYGREPAPVISAQSAMIMDAETGAVLWEKDADTPRYPASTTKILTTLLLLEKTQPGDILTAPIGCDQVTGSSLHLVPGETMTARDIAYAMMLRSANDACYTVAVHLAGSVEGFAKLMNDRAKAIGCTHTSFHNPHGLNDDKHVTSARDLALIAREAMKREDFREIVRTTRYTVERSINTQDTLVISKNKWLRKDPTADGIKTGWTVPAGKCYVGSATRSGFRVITVVLKSEDWQADHAAMLEWTFSGFRKVTVASKETTAGTSGVKGGVVPSVPVRPEADLVAIVPKSAVLKAQVRIEERPNVRAPIKAGTVVGTVVATVGDQEFRTPALATMGVEPSIPRRMAMATGGPISTVLIFGVLGGAAYMMRRKAGRIRF